MHKNYDQLGLMNDEELIAAEFLRLSIGRGFNSAIRELSTKDEIADKTLKQLFDPTPILPPPPSISPRGSNGSVPTISGKLKALRRSATFAPEDIPKESPRAPKESPRMPKESPRLSRSTSRSELSDMFDELDKLTEESVDEDKAEVAVSKPRPASIDASEVHVSTPVLGPKKRGSKLLAFKAKLNSSSQTNLQESPQVKAAVDQKSPRRFNSLTRNRRESMDITPKLVMQRTIEEKFDIQALDELIVATILIAPIFDGLEDYRVIAVNTDKGVRNELERIGSGLVFVKPVHFGEVQVHSVLWLLDAMLNPVHASTIKKFKQFNLSDWFQFLIKNKISRREGLAEELFARIKKLLLMLDANPLVSKLDLLEVLGLEVKAKIQNARQKTDFIERTKCFTNQNVSIIACISPEQQFNNFKKVILEDEKIATARRNLKEGKTEDFFALSAESSKIAVLNEFRLMQMPINLKLQKALVTCLEKGKIRPELLIFSFIPVEQKVLISFFKSYGGNLTVIKLDSQNSINDKIFSELSKHCTKLRKLVLRNTSITKVDSKLPVRKLDLSRNKLGNGVISSIEKYCGKVQSLKLCHTSIGGNDIRFDFDDLTKLDLFGCDYVEPSIFATLRKKPTLQSLRLNSKLIDEINLNELYFLITLDVSQSANLRQVHAKNINGGLQPLRLQVFRANECKKLQQIVVDDAQAMTAFYANNSGLTEIRLAMGRVLHALMVIEIDDNVQLKILMINPAKCARFNALRCHSITTELNEVLCRRLIDKAKGTDPVIAASAFRLLLRVKSNIAHWLLTDGGHSALHWINVPNFDAMGANLEGINVLDADWSGANLSCANLASSVLNQVNFLDVNFGLLPYFDGHTSKVTAMVQSKDGSLLVTGDYGGYVILRHHGDIVYRFKLSGAINTLALSHDERQLAIAGCCTFEKKERVPNPQDDLGEVIIRDDSSDNDSGENVPNPDDELGEALIGYRDRYTIHLYDIQKYKKLWEKRAHFKEINVLAFIKGDNEIVSVSMDDKLKIFESTGTISYVLDGQMSALQCVVLHPDGRYLACAGIEGEIYIFDTESRIITKRFRGHDGKINALVYSTDGKFLISAGQDTRVKKWDAKTWENIKTLEGHANPVTCLAVSTDGAFIFSGDADDYKSKHTIIVWNSNGERLQHFGHESAIKTILVEPKQVEIQGNKTWTICIVSDENKIKRLIFNPATVTPKPDRSDVKTLLDVNKLQIIDPVGLSKNNERVLLQLGAEIQYSNNRNAFIPQIGWEHVEVRNPAESLAFK